MYSRGSSMTHAQEGMLSYFHRFSVFVWKGENNSNTLRVNAYVLEDRGKKSPFSKISGACYRGVYENIHNWIKDERII